MIAYVFGILILVMCVAFSYTIGYMDGRTKARKQKPVGTITQPVKVVTQAKDIWEHAKKFTCSDVGRATMMAAGQTADTEDRVGMQRRWAKTFASDVEILEGQIDYTVHSDFKESDRNVNPYEDGANDAD